VLYGVTWVTISTILGSSGGPVPFAPRPMGPLIPARTMLSAGDEGATERGVLSRRAAAAMVRVELARVLALRW
jgi:hypothetical protein